MTNGTVPELLAQAVLARPDGASILEVVQAVERCQNMAVKLKAAKFLKASSKGTVAEMRAYARSLLEGGADEATEE